MAVIADTGALYAIHDAADSYHFRAVVQKSGRPFVLLPADREI